ncbi:sodium/proline symporter, partial [Thioalkalivibrio sp. XN8]|nr:sodium/proline symporter [Thioalkalivibrio sp. XN8]
EAAVAAAGAPGGPPTAGIAAVGFVLGTLGIGLGYPGQPHVVNRFMALRNERALRDGRVIALSWAVIIYAGMITLGFAARALYGPALPDEQVLFETAGRLFPPVVAAVMIAAVLSAIMSTADSQLLVAASSASHDLPRGGGSLWVSRLVVALISVLAVVIAVQLPQSIFARVLFAWAALGAAFGPPLLARLAGLAVPPAAVFAAMAVGFGGTLLFYWLPNTPGDWLERLVPFGAGLAICLVAARRRVAA